MIKKLFSVISYYSKGLIHCPIFTLREIRHVFVVSWFTRITNFSFHGYDLILPTKHAAFGALRGLYYDGEFAALKGYKHVMDLGGFLGDSALFLAEHNTQVSTLEPCTDNYNLLWINTRNKENIATYHGAIVGQKNIDTKFSYIGGNYNMGGYIQPDPQGTIRSYDLISLYEQNPFDALKIDVEGGEYDILHDIEVLLEKNPGHITCIALEFHDLHKSENAQSYILYADMLTQRGFTHTITDQRSDTKLLYTPQEVVTKLDVILMHSVC